LSIEVSARRYAIDNKAESATPLATCRGSNDTLLCPGSLLVDSRVVAPNAATNHGTCGVSLMIAVNAGMFGLVAAAAYAMVEIVAHLVS
jgi:hypothetical protein